ncbi:MAG: HipA domain-containing protein [Stenotrophobium sp.]
MRTLDVFRDGQLIGQLRDVNDEIEFEYAPKYLAHQPRPISASLPLDPPLTHGARARSFFGNLLPEGDVRTALSRQYKLDAADDVGMLAKLGADCAGALVILPAGEQPLPDDAPFEQRYVPVADEYEFGQLIDALQMSPTAAFKGILTRMSLAGAQSKTAIARFYPDPRIYRSLGGATTHIVKFGGQLDPRGSEVFPGIVFNEYYCSKIATACGIPIRDVEILPYQTFRDGPREYVFCIERYDRQVSIRHRPTQLEHRVTRLQQEDFCQALGRPRTQKYESADGISLELMFRFCSDPDQIIIPAVARKQLLELVLFNLLIGNRDSHAKNYSLLRSGFKAELAPAYDLVCTEVYEGIDRSLPQSIGGASTFDEVGNAQLKRFADEIELRPAVIRREISRLSKAILKAAAKVRAESAEQPFAKNALPVIDQVCARASKNIEEMRARLAHA